MIEVKADALERSFDAFEEEEDGVAALKAELEVLKAKIASGAIAAQRPALDGVKSAEASSFVDQYIRRGDRGRPGDQGDRQLDRCDRRLCSA
jgi:hypothetical protein